MPTRIDQRRRIVVYIAIAIERLRSEHIRNDRVRRQESAHLRIVHAPVHVDQADARQVLVVGVATGGRRGDRATGLRFRSALSCGCANRHADLRRTNNRAMCRLKPSDAPR